MKKFDTVLLECEDEKLLRAAVKCVPVALEILDGTSGHARDICETFLCPVEEAPSSPTLFRKQAHRSQNLAVAPESQP
jgi:hypothetical protein